jgi:hypothetical protein
LIRGEADQRGQLVERAAVLRKSSSHVHRFSNYPALMLSHPEQINFRSLSVKEEQPVYAGSSDTPVIIFSPTAPNRSLFRPELDLNRTRARALLTSNIFSSATNNQNSRTRLQ